MKLGEELRERIRKRKRERKRDYLQYCFTPSVGGDWGLKPGSLNIVT